MQTRPQLRYPQSQSPEALHTNWRTERAQCINLTRSHALIEKRGCCCDKIAHVWLNSRVGIASSALLFTRILVGMTHTIHAKLFYCIACLACKNPLDE